MTVINFEFKKKLDMLIGGDLHSYCFQCGACVGDCPSARYSERFNPRRIMLECIMGHAEDLLAEDSVIWECTNCYNCMERCPQDVRPAEVIIALKNMCGANKTRPAKVTDMVGAVEKTGMTGIVTGSINNIRSGLGLGPVKPAPMDEIRKLLDR
jgi:heterodisulfide reductase subunit C2